jgi:hypothetical protein
MSPVETGLKKSAAAVPAVFVCREKTYKTSFSSHDHWSLARPLPQQGSPNCEGDAQMQMMKKMAVSLAMILMPILSLAEWKIEAQGAKVMNLPNDRIGPIATLPAKAASYGGTAYLQIECFKSPTLTQKHFAIVVTKNMPPGLPYRVKFDDDIPVQRGPYVRTGDGTVHGLDDEAFARLPTARRLQFSFLQPQGPALAFDFDVTGATSAIDAIPCER